MRFSLRSLLAVMTITAFAPMSDAADLVTPAGLNPGDSFRFVFVTAGTRDALATDIADYNTFVRTDATGYTYNGQSITWNVIGSSSTVNARDNVGGFGTNVPVYLVTGTKVANDLTTNSGGLWSGTIAANVNTQLDGTTVPANIWTGTKADGTANIGYLGNAGFSNTGTTAFSTSSWIQYGGAINTDTYRFYGLSADLVVPVPEPSTYALGTIAAGTLGCLARRRKKMARA